ncbi:MAG: DUF3570 domain-containing protein [Deltaproteobacteria bacterium]|nr:DUF3570 domain-containing protein [Deltaproteobacteria bacterium]
MQLRLAALAVAVTTAAPLALADDRVDFSTTWYQENRNGGQGGLTVVHPQLDLGVDLGEHVSLAGRYAADVVSGATASVYSTDAVSSATTFSDYRNEGALGLGFSGSRSRVNFTVGTGVERDYASLTFGGSGSIDLPGKNTNIAASFTYNRDEVCDRINANTTPLERQALIGDDPCEKSVIFGKSTAGQTTWRDLRIATVQTALTQNITPTIVGQLSLYGSILNGYQSNPYRRVRVNGIEAQENVPEVRARIALLARLNKYLPKMRSAVHGSLRGYSDTWGVNSVTLEMGYSQYVGKHLLFHGRARVYQQEQARFFKDAFFYETEGAAGAYFTGDRELSRLRHLVTGAKLSYIAFDDAGGEVWGLFDEVRFNLKGDVLFYDELASDPEELNMAGIGSQFLSTGNFLDGVVLHLSLLATY